MNFKFFILFLFAASIVFIPISCDIKNPVDGLTVRIKNIPRTTTVRVQFFEQNTGSVINTPITIKFSGKDKDKIISDVNVPISELNVKEGIAYFAIKDEIIPTDQNPVEFVIVVQAAGYLSTSQRFFVKDPGSNAFVMNLLKLSATLPAGVISNNQSFGSIATGTGTTSNVSATSGGTYPTNLIVPAGTKLKDANGNVLSGSVTTEIIHFDPTSRAALSAFPGGFLVNAQGSGNGAFISAGFSSINMRVGNTSVESFEPPVTVQIGINPGTQNPVTGTTVRAGDEIPLWSYDESNGTWKFEGNYRVNSKINGSGNTELFVRKENVTHLSWYNLDWFFNSCFMSKQINLVGGCWNVLWWYLEFVNGQGYLGEGIVMSNDPSLQLLNVPNNIPVRLIIFDTYQSLYNHYINASTSGIVAQQVINNLCDEPNQPININLNLASAGQNINVTVRGICPNGNIIDQGTLDLEIFKDGFWQFAGRIINGQITLNCLNVGQTYQFRVFYDGDYYTHQQQITSTNMLIEIQLQQSNQLCN